MNIQQTKASLALQVLCTTSTLAMGVNLPAHLVILKGTRRYCGYSDETPADSDYVNSYREYERTVCLQMIGRAGRPQFDTEGVAVIMTQREVLLLPFKREIFMTECSLVHY